MQRLEVSGAVRPIYGSLGVKRLRPLWVQSVAADVAVRLVPWVRGPPVIQNTKICCRLLRTVFPCCDRRPYSGSFFMRSERKFHIAGGQYLSSTLLDTVEDVKIGTSTGNRTPSARPFCVWPVDQTDVNSSVT